jgi:hypothetical protein
MNWIVLGLLVLHTILLIMVVVNIYENGRKPKGKASGYISSFSLYENGFLLFTIKGKLNLMAISMTDTQIATYTLAFVDKKNKPSDAASVELSLDNPDQGTITYDDPTNTVTITAGDPGVATIKTVAKNSAGEVLPFEDEALEIRAGDAVGGTRSDVVITEQP